MKVIRMNMRVDVLEFDHKTFTKAFQAKIAQLVKNAGKEYYKAAIEKIPIRSGFVHGSFNNLAVAVGIRPIVTSAHFVRTFGKTILNEYYRPTRGSKILKTITSGERFSLKPDQVLSQTGESKFNFKWKVDITYFDIEEQFNNRSPTSPWESLKAGEEAFKLYIDNNLKQSVPKVKDYLIKTVVKV